MKPFIPWMGGKRRLARQILPLFPEHRTYVEPFCGGAAIFFLKEPSPVEVLNDLNGELVNLYRVVKHHLEELLRHFRWALVSRQEFLWNQRTEPDTLTDVQRAARFYYQQKLAFGAKVHGQTFGVSAASPPRLNLLRIEEDLSAAHLRLARVLVERLDWAECVRRYDREATLFYLDPPYWETAGYGVDFGFEQFETMARLAKSIEGRMVISANDHPDLRKVFKGLRRKTLETNYRVGGEPKAAQELVVWNW